MTKQEQNKRYYEKHKKEIAVKQREYKKKWIKENPEKFKERYDKLNNREETNLRKYKWAEENKEKFLKSKREYQRKYVINNPIKYKAQQDALQIPLKPCCEICGETRNLQRHHWRYDKPLTIVTLCSTCHRIQHIKHFNRSIYARSSESLMIA